MATEFNFQLDAITNDLFFDEVAFQVGTIQTNESVIQQRIKTTLQTFQGEWYLDRSLGVPYYEEVLQKNPDVGRVRSLLLLAVNSVRGVKEVLSFVVEFIPATRRFVVNFKVRTDEDQIVEGTF